MRAKFSNWVDSSQPLLVELKHAGSRISSLLSNDNALRAKFELEHGRVLKFTIQLECYFGSSNEWRPVVRYDTAHGFAHCDKLHPYEATTKTEMISRDYNEALNVALNDLVNNWEHYRRRYETWLRQK